MLTSCNSLLGPRVSSFTEWAVTEQKRRKRGEEMEVCCARAEGKGGPLREERDKAKELEPWRKWERSGRR